MTRWMSVLLVTTLIPSGAGAAPPATAAEVEAAVKQVRAEFKAVSGLIAKRKLRRATVRIGGGQNPNVIDVHYQGGGERAYERDPYACPFNLRMAKLELVQPAVGPTGGSFYFDAAGKLVFADIHGTDMWGTEGFMTHPPDRLRVYFHEEQAFRLLHDGAKTETHDLPLMRDAARRKQALRTGEALARYGRRLRDALRVLAACR